TGPLVTGGLLHDRRCVSGRKVEPVAVVARDDGRPAATADALDRAERERAVPCRLARCDPELGLERGQDFLSAAKPAADVRADLDQTPPDRGQMEHVVARRNAFAVGG